jgi:hypothetical protein
MEDWPTTNRLARMIANERVRVEAYTNEPSIDWVTARWLRRDRTAQSKRVHLTRPLAWTLQPHPIMTGWMWSLHFDCSR